MGGCEVIHTSPLCLVFLFPGENNLWMTQIFSPALCLCCHDLDDAEGGVDCQSLCNICCTSLHTPSPTVCTVLCPSGRD